VEVGSISRLIIGVGIPQQFCLLTPLSRHEKMAMEGMAHHTQMALDPYILPGSVRDTY
jgi:hypothetical protein